MLGLAFHPDYQNNGYFYVNYTINNPPRSRIARFQVSPNDPDQVLRDKVFYPHRGAIFQAD